MKERLKVVGFAALFVLTGYASTRLDLGYLFLFPVSFGLAFYFGKKTKLKQGTGILVVLGGTTVGCVLGALPAIFNLLNR